MTVALNWQKPIIYEYEKKQSENKELKSYAYRWDLKKKMQIIRRKRRMACN